ncbi:site-specific integrase [Bacteroides sp.]|uniref:site-specific integrase n=1 Tax=Bacteroides sp. TaxID=29523 RepID=UPI0025C1191D|nr:site-specific integrase [Bacteroides sp.]
MASIKLLLNKQRMLNDGRFPLVFQIIHQRRKLLHYTKYRIFQEQFNNESREVEYCESSVYSAKEIIEINRELKREYKKLRNRILELEKKNEPYSVDDIIESTRKNSRHSYYLLQYIDSQVAYKKAMGKDGIAAAYHSTRISLKKYLDKISTKKTDIGMEKIDCSFVVGYEDCLYAQGLARNTINYYLRNFRTIYNSAIRNGYKPRNNNPFAHIQTKPCKTVKRAINKDDMKDLSSLSLPAHSGMDIARDLYLFGFYAQGMAFVDIVLLKKKNINGNILSYRRHKSKQLIHIVITPQMQVLINKYANSSEYVFPIIKIASSTSVYEQYRLALGRMNRHLKKIASLLNINVRLTTYTARHTWATLARDSGAPISIISAGLGHTSEEMTRVYLKDFDQETLARVNRAVTNLL